MQGMRQQVDAVLKFYFSDGSDILSPWWTEQTCIGGVFPILVAVTDSQGEVAPQGPVCAFLLFMR